jgi:triosephosphate isomerase
VRKPIIAGNWKMNKSIDEAVSLASDVKRDLGDFMDAEIVVCPPFTALKAVCDTITGTQIKLGAQDMHWEKEGAFTGEISAGMLRDVFCRYVIIGHSERRAFFHETNETVNMKVKAALAAALRPIMCVGETLDERKAGVMKDVVRAHVERGLQGTQDAISNVTIAYEPVWAIGTGQTATPQQAQEVHAFIRGLVAKMFGEAAASGMRILYGGSVKPANAKELFGQPDIDGGLIGGAALDAKSFVDIAHAVLKR